MYPNAEAGKGKVWHTVPRDRDCTKPLEGYLNTNQPKCQCAITL